MERKEEPEEEENKSAEVRRKVEKALEADRCRFKGLEWNEKLLTKGEVKNIIKRFKKGKAPGPDGITTDLVKDLNDENIEHLAKLKRKWWTKKEVPNTITLARVMSLYKKEDSEKQENYRPISLRKTFHKIIAAAIQRRPARTLDKLVMNTQYGF